MSATKLGWWLGAIALLGASTVAQAAVTKTVLYQGSIFQGEVPLDGTVTMKLELFDAATGGAQVATVQVDNVQVQNGYFSVGAGALFATATGDLFMAVSIKGANDAAFDSLPRVPVASVPSALRASVADEVDWKNVKNAPTAIAGVAGPAGPQGPAGVLGASGLPGSPGTPGVAGPQGVPGASGALGLTGLSGSSGDSVMAMSVTVGNATCPEGGSMFTVGSTTTYACNGTKGVGGPAGALGNPGSKGDTGASGEGLTAISLTLGDPDCAFGGAKLTVGTTVTFACNGASGAAGPKGDLGSVGPAGLVGSAGPQGSPGTPGAQGAPGAIGSPGLVGAAGPQGSPGTPGAQGAPGAVGSPGLVGAKGDTGSAGPVGNVGLMGVAGPKGDIGQTGPIGLPGVAGPQGNVGPSVVALSLAVGNANCANGGSQFTAGGVTTYACNAAAGGGTSSNVTDKNGVVIGRFLTISNTGVTVINASGYTFGVNWDGSISMRQTWFTGAGCTGTAVLNSGSSTVSNIYGRTTVKSLATGKFYRIVSTNVTTNLYAASSVYGTATAIENIGSGCSASSSGANGWLLEETTAAAVGIPATITPPLQIPG
jgi:hypothetical protein